MRIYLRLTVAVFTVIGVKRMKEKIRKFFAILSIEFDDIRDGLVMLMDSSEERFRKHEITGYVWTENNALMKREEKLLEIIQKRVEGLNPDDYQTLDEAVEAVRKIVRGMSGIPQAVPEFIEKRVNKVLRYINNEM